MSVIKGTFFSRFESEESDFCRNERLLFELNELSKIKKNVKKWKKVLQLYVPFFTDRDFYVIIIVELIIFIAIFFLYPLSHRTLLIPTVMPDSVWHLGEMWQERCAIIVTRPRVGARDDIFFISSSPL